MARTPEATDVISKLRKDKETWNKEDREPVDKKLYLSLIGSLQFAATMARPDIAFATSCLAQYSQDPLSLHLGAAIRVLKYLLNTQQLKLVYSKKSERQTIGYSDSDWANEKDSHSRGAFVFIHGGAAILWRTKKLA